MGASVVDARPAAAPAQAEFAVLEGVSAAVVVFSRGGELRPVFVNQACSRLLGLPRDALLGDDALAWLPANAVARLATARREAFDRGEAECGAIETRAPCRRLRLAARLRRLGDAAAAHCIVTLLADPGDRLHDETVEQLRQRADLLGAALDVAATAAWRWDRETDSVHVEQWRAPEAGPRFEADSMTKLLRLTVPEDREQVAQAVADALADDGIHRFEYRASATTGETRWYATSMRRYLDAAGRPAGLLGATRDATLRKQWELTLAQNEEWMRSILETEPECVKVLDAQGRIQLMNPAGLAMLEADDPVSVLGRAALELVMPEQRDAFRRLHQRAMAGETGSLEFEIQGLRGGRRWLDGNAAPLRDGAGGISTVIMVVRDVTERRQAEARLRVQAQILDTLSEGVVLMTERAAIGYANAAFGGLLGLPPGSLMGTSAAALIDRPKANLARVLAAMRQARERPVAFETPLRHASGEPRLVRVAATTVTIDDQEHWIGVVQDITELKQLEREIIEAADREQERISRDLHDGLGQELTGIALMLKGLHQQLERESSASTGDLGELLGLVNDAIEGTRQIAHGLSPVAVERGGLVQALRSLAARADDPAGVRVRFRCAAWPPGRLGPSLSAHLYRIAQESLANALRHAGAAEIRISLGMSSERMNLRIVDDGRGLPAGDPSRQGLGHRIMRYRAELIGATLRITRPLRGGTEVLVSWPRPAPAGEQQA